MRVRVAQSGSNSVNKSSRRRDKSVEEKELLTEFVVSLEKKERKEECRGKWNTTHSFIGSSRPSHCREAARTHKTWSDWHKSDLYIFGKLLKVSHSQSITHSHARTHAHACIDFYFLALVLLPHPPSPSLLPCDTFHRVLFCRQRGALSARSATAAVASAAAIGHWNACIYILKLRSLFELPRISTLIESVVLQLYFSSFFQLSDVVRRLLVQVCVRMSFAPVCVYVRVWLNLHECCCCRSPYLYVCVFDVSESNFLPAGLKCRQARIVLFWIINILYDTWTQLVGVCVGWGAVTPPGTVWPLSLSRSLSLSHMPSLFICLFVCFLFSFIFPFFAHWGPDSCAALPDVMEVGLSLTSNFGASFAK